MFPTVTSTPTRTLIVRNVATRTPTNTATLSMSPDPTATPSPLLIATSKPVSTSKVPIRLGGYKTFSEGGFALRPIVGYKLRAKPSQISLESNDGDIVITFMGSSARRVGDLEPILTRFLELFAPTMQDFNYGEFFDYMIDGGSGLATEITGRVGNTKVRGQVAIVAPSNQQLFYAIAIGADGTERGGWEPQGRQAFEAIAKTVIIFSPREDSSDQ